MDSPSRRHHSWFIHHALVYKEKDFHNNIFDLETIFIICEYIVDKNQQKSTNFVVFVIVFVTISLIFT
jgi:hypothetical protein